MDARWWTYSLCVLAGCFFLPLAGHSVLLDRMRPLMKTCRLSEIPGDVIDCQEKSDLGEVPSGSKCYVSEPNHSKDFETLCFRGTWHRGTEISYPEHRRKRIFGWIAAAIMACVAWCGGDDTVVYVVDKPPTITCPTIDSPFTAARGTTKAKVEWGTPTATDPEGDTVEVNQVGGGRSGSDFELGSHSALYSAKDSKGNKDFCTIPFTVVAITCSGLDWPRNGQKNCDGDDYWGTTCTFTCDEGYEIVGSATSTCGENGKYSHTTPSCSRVKCQEPEDPKNGEAFCTRPTFTFGTTCMTQCEHGYTPSLFMFSECLENKAWSSPVSPCEDIEPPRLMCPGVKRATTGSNSNTANVTWETPTATDNSDGPISVQIVDSEFGPGSEFPLGITSVTYRAIDQAGNESPTCTILIIVEALSCPPPRFDDEYLVVDCSSDSTYHGGSSCSLSCLANLPLNGPTTITCQKNDTTGTGYWGWDWDSEPHCEWVDCPDLDPPDNGALSCDTGLAMKWCGLLCNAKYDVSPRLPRDTDFVCGSSRTWNPPTVPDCSLIRNPEIMYLPSEMYYYNATCGGEEAEEEIREKFMIRMEEIKINPKWEGICEELSCDINKLEIICGEVSRRKRSVYHLIHKNSARSVRRGKREAYHHIHERDAAVAYQVSFQIELIVTGDLLANSSALSIEETVMQLATTIEESANSGNLDIDGVETRSGSFNHDVFAYWQCPYGQAMDPEKFEDAACVGCPKGTYYDEQSDSCLKCSRGTYRDNEDDLLCTPCPEGRSTIAEGSKNASKCIAKCQPGTYSLTGLSPCSVCELGQYQTDPMSTNCTPCPRGTITETKAATSPSECHDFDILIPDEEEVSLLLDLPNATDGWTLATWVYWGDVDGNLNFTMKDVSLKFSPLGVVIQNESLKHDARKDSPVGGWTHFTVMSSEISGTVLVYVNGVPVLDEVPGFPLTGEEMSFKYEGPTASEVGLSGFNFITSPTTSEEIEDLAASCNSKSDNASITMTEVWNNINRNVDLVIPTECDNFDACQDAPCGDSHVCGDTRDGFVCICSGGYSGDRCEVPPDYCIGNECKHGSTCRSTDRNYTCDCLPGYEGDLCQDAPVDGQWSVWTGWSVCDVTCGGGTEERIRSCNSPPPDEFGKPCEGVDKETAECNTYECLSCPELRRPFKSFLKCEEKDGMNYCNQSCADGYEFLPGHDPKEPYKCGRGTNYEWMHSTIDNPLNDLPRCSKIGGPGRLRSRTLTSYRTLGCNDGNDVRSALDEKLQKLPCAQNGVCQRETTVNGCEGSGKRRRSAGLSLSISLKVDIATGELNLETYFENGTISDTLQEIINAVTNLEESLAALQNNSDEYLDLVIGGTTYPVDPSSITSSGEVDCPAGSQRLEVFCTECTTGTMEKDGSCVLCERGTYQDDNGQTSCKPCPEGMTTLGIGALSSTYCDVEKTTTPTTTEPSKIAPTTPRISSEVEDENQTELIVLLCVSGVLGGIVLTLIVFFIRNVLRKRGRSSPNGSLWSLGTVRPIPLKTAIRDDPETIPPVVSPPPAYTALIEKILNGDYNQSRDST